MSKKILVLLAASLTFALIQPLANAAVKPGTKCTKLGQTSTSAGIKYTCIKSGKKLVWNKGVVVKKPTPTPSPTAIGDPIGAVGSTPTRTATPVPSATPTPTPTVKPLVTTLTFDDLVQNYLEIPRIVWTKSRDVILSSTKKAPPFRASMGPNTQLIYKTPEVAFDLVSKLYSGYEVSPNLVVLSFNFADVDWAATQMQKEVPVVDSRWIKGSACKTKVTCWGGGVFIDDKDRALLVITTEIKDANHLTGTLEAHEYTHAIQQNQMVKVYQLWPMTEPWPPTWYVEGHALYSQNATIYHTSFQEYLSGRKEVTQELYKSSIYTSEYIQEFFTVKQNEDWYKKYDSWRQYDLGSMLVEILVAIKGPASTMEMWKLAGTGVKFEDAFERIYGTSFAKALPIIAKAIALQLGKS
jgi:hypothetical protein